MSLPPFDALIFDCDGTLADSMPAHFVSWQAMLEPHNISFTEEMFYELAGIPSNKIIDMLSEEHGIEMDSDEMARQKEAAFLQSIDLLKPIQAVIDIANRCHGRLPLAVASGGTREVVDAELQHLGIAQMFDAIVTAEDTEHHKPEPDVFLEAARRLGVSPEKCLVYEDADLGIEAARRANMSWVDIRKLVPAGQEIKKPGV